MNLLSGFAIYDGSSRPTSSSRLSCGGGGGLGWIFSRISRIIVSTLFLLLVVVVKTGRSQTVEMSGDLKTTTTSSSSNDDQNHAFLLPQIVTASEGGWPTNLVGEPFRYGESLYCHTKNPHSSDDGSDPFPAECIGFDWHSRDENIKRCKFSSLTNTTHIDLRCPYDDTESSYYHIHLSSRCCERFIENDASIYKATNGLHFTSMVNPMPMVKGVQLMQRDYPSATYDGTTLFLHYNFYDFDTRKYHEIPDRVLKSQHYKDIYRAMPRHITLSVDQKLQHAKRVVSLQQQQQHQQMSNHGSNEVDLPFPKTYLTCKDALEARSSTPDTLYYYKNARKTRGEGIQVLTRQQLEKMFFRGQCRDWDNVIQEAVTDLETISNKRFDIRFYILTHNGRMYLHQNALMIYLENAPGSIYDPNDPISMKLSASRELGKDGAVVRVYSNEQPELWSKFWLKSIANGLVTALPVFDKVMQASKADPHLYQIWGGDAMIRSNGQVVFPEFNDWPNINYSEEKSHTSKLLSPTEFGPIIQGDFEDEYINFVGQMSADFYSIVLNLADRSDPTNMCGGRVTEILPPAPTPSTPSEECEA